MLYYFYQEMDDFAKVFGFFEPLALAPFEQALISELYPYIKQIIVTFTRTRWRYGEYPRYDRGSPDTQTILDYKGKIDKIVKVLDSSDGKQEKFLKNFPKWRLQRKQNIEKLRKIAESMKEVRTVSNIVKITAGSVGLAGGITALLSILVPPLAVVALPLGIGGGVTSALGGGVVVGTTITETVLLKNMLEEAKTVAEEDQENFSTMEQWFTHTQQLKEALGNLIDYDLLVELSNDLQNFRGEVNDQLDSLKDDFREVLTECIGKMCKKSNIVELYGVVCAPVVMTFVLVVCLMRDHSRIALNCIVQVERFAVGIMSVVDVGVQVGRLSFGLATKGATIAGRTVAVATSSVFIALGAVIDVVNIVLSSIDIHNRVEPEHATEIKDVANKLDDEFSFIKKVYDELTKWKSIDRDSVTEWKTFIISHVPCDAWLIDIKMSVKPHLSEEAWSCVKVQRCSIIGNDWLVKVPASHSQMLLRQSHLFIKSERCQVAQMTAWTTFIVHHIPNNARQEDIKGGITPHLPKEASISIKLQKLSTGGNNWLVKVPTRHSQNLKQQTHIIVNRERCLVTQ